MKRIICLLLTLIMVVSVFASCNQTPDADENTTDADVTTEAEGTTEAEVTTEPETTEPEGTTEPEVTTEPEETTEPEPVLVMKGYDLADFKIVYAGDHNLDVAEKLQSEIEEKTGVELAIVTSSAEESDCEFIIGNAGRDVSDYCYDYKNNKYMESIGILCDDGKVQILGVAKTTMRDSIEYFIDNVVTKNSTTVQLAEEGAICEKINLTSEKINQKTDESYIRVITNNILQEWIANNTYKLPATKNRISELVAAYALLDADIIGFQEVDSGWYTTHNLKGEMEKLGYTLAGNYTSVGCPIYYKTDRFNLLDKGYSTFDTTMFADGPYEARSYAWAVLEEKTTGKQLVVANSHFVWGWGSVNGSSDTALGYRNESARQLVALIKEKTAAYPGSAGIVMGDLNSYLGSEVCNILANDMLSSRDTAERKVNTNYDSDMPNVGVKPGRGTTPKVIDHIYYSGTGITAKRYEVCIAPYAYTFSDHVPVIADFAFN